MSESDIQAVLYFNTSNPCLRTLAFKSVGLRSPSISQISTFVSKCPSLKHLDLSWSHLSLESCIVLTRALGCIELEELKLSGCMLGPQGVRCVCQSFHDSPWLKRLDISYNAAKAIGAAFIADLITRSTSLQHINVRYNEIGISGGTLLANALVKNTQLCQLVVTDNKIGVDIAALIAGRLNGGIADISQSFSVSHESDS